MLSREVTHPLSTRRLGTSSNSVTVVGIVADVQREALEREAELTFYVPFAQFTRGNVSFAARTRGDPGQVIPLLRQAV